MITDHDTQNKSLSEEPFEWVEVRVDDDGTGTHSTYVGQIDPDLLKAWNRIEHGEVWFQLYNVMWHENVEARVENIAPTGFWRSLFNGASQPKSSVAVVHKQSSQRGLQRQSIKARYWGYSNRVYLRLDKVFRIIPLAEDYIANVVRPVLMDETQ